MRQAAERIENWNVDGQARAFDDLQYHGFIVAEQRGHFHWKINPAAQRIARQRVETDLYGSNIAPDFDSQQHGTKEFMRWSKIQNAVPPQVRMVPNTGPHGTHSGTMRIKKVLRWYPYGTIKGVLRGGWYL